MIATVKEKELRCPLCATEPLLAMYGIDENGRLFIHIKVYKAKVMKAEVFIRGGEVTLRCSKCLKYHIVKIIQKRAVLKRTSRPDSESQIMKWRSLTAIDHDV